MTPSFRTPVAPFVLVGLALGGCAAGVNPLEDTALASGVPAAGFWLGLWHGVIAPIAFVISLFSETVGVYEIHNNGGWYHAGLLLGLSISLGGPHGARRACGRKAAR